MSFPAIRFALDFPGLSLSERAVLVALADRASQSGHCFPSQSYLAERSGAAVRTVRQALTSLEEKGAIKRSARFDATGRTSDDFLILMRRVPAKSAATPPAVAAGTPRQNVPTIPTCPTGLGKGEEEKASARKLVLIAGGRQ
jgi:DNA-binding transcriptional MocR family regulator